jgi:3-oxoacyl-[acyl-carrier-protein] synthase III
LFLWSVANKDVHSGHRKSKAVVGGAVHLNVHFWVAQRSVDNEQLFGDGAGDVPAAFISTGESLKVPLLQEVGYLEAWL